jgi:hypothetical protein
MRFNRSQSTINVETNTAEFFIIGAKDSMSVFRFSEKCTQASKNPTLRSELRARRNEFLLNVGKERLDLGQLIYFLIGELTRYSFDDHGFI